MGEERSLPLRPRGLNTGDLDQLIWGGDYDENSSSIADAQNVRGFHTLEFLLFKDGQARTVPAE